MKSIIIGLGKYIINLSDDHIRLLLSDKKRWLIVRYLEEQQLAEEICDLSDRGFKEVYFGDCNMCMEENVVLLPTCLSAKHLACPICFISSIEMRTTLGTVGLTCPDIDCNERIDRSIFDGIPIKQAVIERFDELLLLDLMKHNKDRLINCVDPKCGSSFIVVPEYINSVFNSIGCPRCNKNICLLCNNELHIGRTCVEQTLLSNSAVLSNSKDIPAKNCPKCGCKVIKYRGDGCHAIYCQCLTTWCYVCEKVVDKSAWLIGKHSCKLFCYTGCPCPELNGLKPFDSLPVVVPPAPLAVAPPAPPAPLAVVHPAPLAVIPLHMFPDPLDMFLADIPPVRIKPILPDAERCTVITTTKKRCKRRNTHDGMCSHHFNAKNK